MDSLYLANLDEFINDERRMVSYKWLSLTLNVSSNEAKQMLYHYVQVHKSSNTVTHDLHITYIVSGIVTDPDIEKQMQKICIVQDSDLQYVKSQMSKIISIHVYSVQRAHLSDLNLLFVANYDKVKEDVNKTSKFSSIHCSAATTRLQKPIEAQPPTEHITKPNVKVSTITNNNDALKTKEIKAEPVIKRGSDVSSDGAKKLAKGTPKSSTKAGGGAIAALFANQTKKGPAVSRNKTSSSNNKKGNLTSFFPKLTSKPPPPPQAPVKTSIAEKEEKTQIIEEEVTDEIAPVKKEVKTSPKRYGRTQKVVEKKKRKSSVADDPSNLKRRRIIKVESESSSEGETEEEEEEVENSEECPLPPAVVESDDDEDIIPATPQDAPKDVLASSKPRKKKLVDTTFTDPDGFLVTKKEYKFVTDYSEDENPLPPKKQTPTKIKTTTTTKTRKTSPKKQKISSQNSKQSSIKNFFSKG